MTTVVPPVVASESFELLRDNFLTALAVSNTLSEYSAPVEKRRTQLNDTGNCAVSSLYHLTLHFFTD
jgi:hypothetical protein